jgi:hypothetical protein
VARAQFASVIAVVLGLGQGIPKRRWERRAAVVSESTDSETTPAARPRLAGVESCLTPCRWRRARRQPLKLKTLSPSPSIIRRSCLVVVTSTRGQPLRDPLTGHTDTVNSVALGQVRGRDVIISGSGGVDGTVRIWDLGSDSTRGRAPHRPHRLGYLGGPRTGERVVDGQRGVGTSTWPPAGTSSWPPAGTFSWPRTGTVRRRGFPPACQRGSPSRAVCRGRATA